MSDHVLDRRDFVAGVLGAGGVLALGAATPASAKVDPTVCSTAPKVFKAGQDTRPITLRGTVEQLWADKTWLGKLDAGYAWMRALPADDPRSLVQQGNIHNIMCSGGAKEVHGSDRFLAWHRCYIYFQERIVAFGSTGGTTLDPEFRLAVWDWEGTSTTPAFPEAFRHGSLVDANRQPSYSPGDGNVDAALATNDIFTFYGYPVGSGGGGSPVLENAVHGQIHVDTGNQTPPYHDMGALQTAALDPVFCAHHGNIDKVWAWWQQLHPNRTPNTTNPATNKPYDPAWLKNTWSFYDYDGTCWSIAAADTIDYKNNLRFSYAPPPGAKPIKQFPVAFSRSIIKVPPEAHAAAVPGRTVSMLLRDVQIPAPGTGRFNLVANVGGTARRVGHFALFAHAMDKPVKASVLARVDPQAVSVLQSGASFRIVPGPMSPFGRISPTAGTQLQAGAATLLVQ